jgi:S-ribosylhomocysteine lyase LuxS involved in autoinducer biosynthesis
MFGIKSVLEESIEEYEGPGVYEREKKYDVKKWEVRMVSVGETIDFKVAHTVEHYLATYFKNVLTASTYHVGLSGCGTGFYILTTDAMSRRTLLLGLLGAHAYINSEQEIPGDGIQECQNPDTHDYESAKNLFNEFYNTVLLTVESEVYEDLLRLPSTLKDL